MCFTRVLAAPAVACARGHGVHDGLFPCKREQLQQAGTGYVLAQARGQAFRHGFFDQSAQLWDESGTLLVTSHQLVYFKE